MVTDPGGPRTVPSAAAADPALRSYYTETGALKVLQSRP
ncbi:hypothetical protein FHS34_008250 [Streptomyces echinatus]|uniref:Uncharacterized protein n=1 Tax=Streptomyces echinatus TaxID=67293 RepID=A0A7W9UVE8_9ACTN|nr:hypothetical protein [Streptomyces echinatus]